MFVLLSRIYLIIKFLFVSGKFKRSSHLIPRLGEYFTIPTLFSHFPNTVFVYIILCYIYDIDLEQPLILGKLSVPYIDILSLNNNNVFVSMADGR